MAQFMFFGDSITFGAWDTQGGWVDRVKNYIQTMVVESDCEVWHEVFNMGISGDETTHILSRLDNEISCRYINDEPIVFVAVGTNDTVFRKADNKQARSVEEYVENLGKILDIAKKHAKKITFIGLLPVDESKTNPIGYSTTGKCYNNKRIKEFDAALAKFTAKERVGYLPLYQTYLDNNHIGLLFDGVHPNNQGHELIANGVINFIKDKKWL